MWPGANSGRGASAGFGGATGVAAVEAGPPAGRWPAALSIWGGGPDGGQMLPEPVTFCDARWQNGMLTARSLEPLSLERLAERAHRDGLVTGACVHTFNRWAWTEAEALPRTPATWDHFLAAEPTFRPV